MSDCCVLHWLTSRCKPGSGIRVRPPSEEASHRMKGYIAALGLAMLLATARTVSATTATIDFNDSKNSTTNTNLLSDAPNGKTTTVNSGGRNAVQTGGTTDNQ